MIAIECSETRRAVWTRRLTGTFLLILLASTWRLWTPRESIPGLPVSSALASVPIFVNWLLLAIVILLCAVWTMSNGLNRIAASGLLAALVALLLLDQLRWQPWAMQAWLFVAVLALAPPRDPIRLLRWLIIGIYFHAAIAKIDHEFAHTLGQQFLGTLLHPIGVQLESIPVKTRLYLSLAFPIAELFVAALLCFRRTICMGVVAAVLMHLTTIMILGPTGLNHAWGVLVWNLWLAIQTPVLFWPLPLPHDDGQPAWSPITVRNERQAASRYLAAIFLVGAAVLLPFTTRFGYWDTWPSWGLYAPGAERSTIWIHEIGVEKLPPELTEYVRGDQTWRLLQLDRWALDKLQAPLYPQNRVRLALANAIAAQADLGDLIRVEVESPSNRRTGTRISHTLDDQRGITQFINGCWLNSAATR